MTPAFIPWPKIARLSREVIITEKIDGTNASIYIAEGYPDTPQAITSWRDHETQSDMIMLAGSRTRWITPESDNSGFARWVKEHAEELKQLGTGHHFGEWWGQGIQRGYGLTEKRFSLFNVSRWCLHGKTPKIIQTADPRVIKTQDILPSCCHLVPLMYQDKFDTYAAEGALKLLSDHGSWASPGFMRPEGVVVFHIAGNVGFKKTLEKDHEPKGKQNQSID